MTFTKRNVVEMWFSEIWDARNTSFLDKLLAPSLGEGDLAIGNLALRKDIPMLVEVFHRLMGVMKTEILVYLEDGDWACVNFKTTANGPNGDTPIELESLFMFRFEQGLIAEMIARIDSLSLFEQLGQMPPDTLPGCFSGRSPTWQ